MKFENDVKYHTKTLKELLAFFFPKKYENPIEKIFFWSLPNKLK